MHNTEDHILVTGAHRSGSTWVGRTIAQHPHINYIHEPFNVNYPNRLMDLKLNTWFTEYESSNQQDDIRISFDKLLQGNALDYAIRVSRANGWGIKAPLRLVKHLLLGAVSKSRILIKDPIALLSAGWLYERYDLQVICMIRNPLAFAGSLKKAGWDFNFENLRKQKKLMLKRLVPFTEQINKLCDNESDFIDRACLLWNILHFRIAEYQKMYSSWIFVRHEDIVMNPVSEFEAIFHSLGLDMNADIRDYIAAYTSDKNQTDTNSVSYAPRNAKESLHTWRERLTAQECERVKNATRKIATLFYDDHSLEWQ